MKIAGFFLLAAGWLLVLSAVILLGAVVARGAFIAAGLATQGLGLALVLRAHLSPATSRRPERN